MARNVACGEQLSFGECVHEWRPLWWQRAARYLAPALGCGGGCGRLRPGRPVRWEARINAFWSLTDQAWTEVDECAVWDDAEHFFVEAVREGRL